MAYCFGDFTLDPRTGTLTGPEGVVPLRRQAFRLCEVLLENAPELMDRDQLLDQIWGRTAVSPNALPQAISELRQALGDDPQSPRYIETMHRRGYRLICAVEQVEAAGSPPPASPPADPVKSPVVQNESGKHSPNSRYMRTIFLAVLVVTGVGVLWQVSQRDTLYRDTIPAIRTAVDSDVFDAWRKTREAMASFPDDPELRQLMLDLTIPVSLDSQPSGASMMVGPYDADESDWVSLGQTPLKDIRLPLTMLRFRVEKPGFVGLDVAPSILPFPEVFQLHAEAETPPGMVFVPPGSVRYMGQTRDLTGFWIQENEVSNRDYLEFVEARGYETPEFWKHDVVVHGVPLSQDEIMARFVDSTGIAGPSTWALGIYPSGKDNHPVEGISWFEAAAYAEFRGLELPTAFHWWRAAGRGGAQHMNFADVVSSSNYQGTGAWQVGQGGLGPHGTRDMAGNVGEWCSNPSGESRHFLGGSWLTSSFAFMDWFAQPAMSRGDGFGLRLIKPLEPIPADQRVALSADPPEQVTPISDETFAIFARQYDYDDTPLNARIEEEDASQQAWRRERITFDAAYGDERVILQLFIPNAAEPPYQVVIHFPGGDAVLLDRSADAGLLSVEPFLRTGRAVAYPVYKGTFERKVRRQRGPMGIRKELIEQTQDVRRTIDYLFSRGDIAHDKIAFHGLSYGGMRAPFILAIEKRFATAMILSAGIPAVSLPPEITVQHYLPRVTLPTLFLGGRDDFNQIYETAQIPFFELLGTPANQKKHVTFEGGHLPTGYSGLKKELITWMDETLGRP